MGHTTVAPALTEARSRPTPLAPRSRRGDVVSPDGWEILADPYDDRLDDVCAGLWMVLRDVQHWMDRTQRNGLFGHRNHKVRARLLRAMDAVVEQAASALRAEIAARIPPEQENPEACPYAVEVLEKMFSVRLRRWLAPDRRGTGANGKPVNAADRERKRL